MKHHPPHMVKVGDLITDPKASYIHRTIVEISDTEESVSFFIGISRVEQVTLRGRKRVTPREIRNEVIYLKKEDKWVWTGEGDIQVCKETPKFYLEITKEMDRNEQLNKILE